MPRPRAGERQREVIDLGVDRGAGTGGGAAPADLWQGRPGPHSSVARCDAAVRRIGQAGAIGRARDDRLTRSVPSDGAARALARTPPGQSAPVASADRPRSPRRHRRQREPPSRRLPQTELTRANRRSPTTAPRPPHRSPNRPSTGRSRSAPPHHRVTVTAGNSGELTRSSGRGSAAPRTRPPGHRERQRSIQDTSTAKTPTTIATPSRPNRSTSRGARSRPT